MKGSGTTEDRMAAAEPDAPAPPKADPGLKLFRMSAKDRQAPPFHYSNVAHSYVVAAHDEKEARAQAAATAERYGDVYMDEAQTDCVPLVLSVPGVIGSEVTV